MFLLNAFLIINIFCMSFSTSFATKLGIMFAMEVMITDSSVDDVLEYGGYVNND